MNHSMKKIVLSLSVMICACALAAQDMSYQLPPKVIADIALAPRPPYVSISENSRWLLLLDRAPFLSVEELAQPEYKLAGTRVNGLFGESRVAGFTGARLVETRSLPTKKEYSFPGFPAQANIIDAGWSPNSTNIAFTVKMADGYYLWMASSATQTVKQASKRRLNQTLGSRLLWINDETLIVPVVPATVGKMPQATGIPSGPVIQESDGKAAPARTYQDLLKNPYD